MTGRRSIGLFCSYRGAISLHSLRELRKIAIFKTRVLYDHAELGDAVKHFRQRIRAFLDYKNFMVVSGRCDPPWVTLAECDRASVGYAKKSASQRCQLLGDTVRATRNPYINPETEMAT